MGTDTPPWFQWLLVSGIVLLPIQLGTYWWSPHTFVSGLRLDQVALHPTHPLLFHVVVVGVYVVVRRQLPTHMLKLTGPLWGISLIQLALGWGLWVVTLWWLAVVSLVAVLIDIWRQQLRNTPALTIVFSVQVVVLGLLAAAQLWSQQSLQGAWYWLGERAYSMATPGIATEAWGAWYWVRPYATFSHPNVLGGYSVVLVAWLLQYGTGRIRGLGILAGLIVVLLSWSHGAWMAAGCMLPWVLRRSLPQRVHSLAVAVPLWAVVVGWWLVPLGISLLGQQSAVMRSELWHSLLSSPTALLHGSGPWGRVLGYGLDGLHFPTLAHLQPLHHVGWLVVDFWGIVGCLSLLLFRRVRALLVSSWTIVDLPLILLLVVSSLDHYVLTQPQTLLLGGVMLGWWLAHRHNTV